LIDTSANFENSPYSSAEPRIMLEQALLLHPGVRDAAAFNSSGEELIALVVPEDRYLDEVLGRAAAQATTIAKWQKAYDLNQSSKAAIVAPSGFNTLGWDSTYTRRPLPEDDMREWIQTSVDSILDLKPKALLEIGCGTGLLLMRIAPVCERYVALDFSRGVLERLREQLAAVPNIAERVEVMERRADNLAGFETKSFDTVIINSAAQYFPNLGYLTRVLESAASLVKDGGHIFIGDVRSLPLLAAFATSVELFQVQDEVLLAELQQRASKRLRHTPELVLSPAFFFALQQRLPRLSRVDINLRLGRADNEMTRYRYNAILHIGPELQAPCNIAFQDWSDAHLSLEGIRAMLRSGLRSGSPFGVSRIPNVRIAKDLLAHERLATADPSLTAGDFRRMVEQSSVPGAHPQDLLDAGADSGFRVFLSWAACRGDGSYDAAFIPATASQPYASAVVPWPEPHACAFAHLANTPGQSKFLSDLMERILAHCHESLPPSCMPFRIVWVDSIPRSSDGVPACTDLAAFER